MTDSASQGLVERLKQQSLNRAGKFGAGSYVATVEWQAAIRITKLEAERDRLASELDASNNNHRAMACQMAELGARCKHAESELSRVEVETRKVLSPFVDALESCGIVEAHDGCDIWESPAAMSITVGDLRRAAELLRSLPPLAKRGEQKSCERSNPPAEQSTTLPQQLTEN